MTAKPRIIYAGTPDFATPPLRALLDAGHQVVGVYTQPDRPAGRGRKASASPVKQCALEAGLPVCQPLNFRDEAAIEELEAFAADLMIVAAYGLILPQRVLDAPRLGCINIHASLLPRWRGAAPIQRAILAGDDESGITIMRMEAGLDTGPMLHKATCPIQAEDTGGELHDRLAALGAEALMAALPGILDGSLKGEVQDDALANYAKKLEKQEATIDWSQSAAQIDRQIRAFNPWPVAQTPLGEKMLRVWRATPMAREANAEPGMVVACTRDGVDVASGDGVLRILQLQLPGKRAMHSIDFVNAHNLEGETLG